MNYMEWARYSALRDPQFFLVTEGILNVERDIEKRGGERQTDALYETRRFEYPWAFLQIPEEAQTMLDAGGGPSTFQYFLAKYVSRVYNIDKCLEWVDKVNGVKKLMGDFDNLTIEKGDLTDLSRISDKMFDATTCISVIEHGQPEEALKIIDELLRVTDGPVMVTADVGYDDVELMKPEVLHMISDRYGFMVPWAPVDVITRGTVKGNKYRVACIRLEGGVE